MSHQGSHQTSPEESLVTLRHGLTAGAEVIEGLLRSQRVPFRLFHAALSQVYREIDRSAFFNPLNALEFRPEFDRIKASTLTKFDVVPFRTRVGSDLDAMFLGKSPADQRKKRDELLAEARRRYASDPKTLQAVGALLFDFTDPASLVA